MKSNLIKVAFVAAIALVSSINVFNAQKSEPLSDIAHRFYVNMIA